MIFSASTVGDTFSEFTGISGISGERVTSVYVEGTTIVKKKRKAHLRDLESPIAAGIDRWMLTNGRFQFSLGASMISSSFPEGGVLWEKTGCYLSW
jgi:hypothetical protein